MIFLFAVQRNEIRAMCLEAVYHRQKRHGNSPNIPVSCWIHREKGPLKIGKSAGRRLYFPRDGDQFVLKIVESLLRDESYQSL